jgi:ADP-sugar diphosphatase
MRTINILVGTKVIPVYGLYEHIKYAEAAPQFKDFCTSLDARFNLKRIQIQSVDVTSHKVLFVKCVATLEDVDGKEYTRVALLRGGSFAILIILQCEGEEYVVLSLKRTFPIGKYESLGLPTGMLDGSKRLSSVAIKEIAQEVGVEINEEELIDMTALIHKKKSPGLYPSMGGCDEFVTLLLLRREVDRDTLEHIKGKLTAASLVRYNDVIDSTFDMKAVAAVGLYEHLLRRALV